jgi:predicted phosphoribosyltransferase
MGPRFRDRRDGGRQLAGALSRYRGRGEEVVVVGLPRGGVPVAFEVARQLEAPLDVLLVRKLGVPYQPELALGAIAAGVRVLDERVVRESGLSEPDIEAVAAAEEAELHRREQAYRGTGGEAGPSRFAGRVVILVDDGLATGSSMLAAVAVARRSGARAVVVAVPVAAAETCDRLEPEVDDLVCLATPAPFRAVGLWYEDFSEVTDAEVRDLIGASRERASAESPEASQPAPASSSDADGRPRP